MVIELSRYYLCIIEDCAKDGGEEFFTEMHCALSSTSCRIVKDF